MQMQRYKLRDVIATHAFAKLKGYNEVPAFYIRVVAFGCVARIIKNKTSKRLIITRGSA